MQEEKKEEVKQLVDNNPVAQENLIKENKEKTKAEDEKING